MGLGLQVAIKVRIQSGSVLSNAIRALLRVVRFWCGGWVFLLRFWRQRLRVGEPLVDPSFSGWRWCSLGVHGFGGEDVDRARIFFMHSGQGHQLGAHQEKGHGGAEKKQRKWEFDLVAY